MKNRYQAIYTFFEKDGQVTPDIVYYLKELKKVISSILVVVNGKINPESRKILQNLDVNILVRANEGLDFGAWQAGIQEIGWDRIRKLDGLLLCDCTCFGPIYPFQEMFDVMSKKECDFWGINRHPEIDVYLVDNDCKSKVIEYLQSYFLFFRSSILKDAHFRKWWDNLVLYSDYKKEVGYHETKFTKYLEDAGFKSASYMDFDKYKNFILDNATIKCPDIQLIEDRNPLLKKRIFTVDYDIFFVSSSGFQIQRILDYIKEKTNYDINYILDWVIKNNKLSSIHKNLHLNWILPTNVKVLPLRNQSKVAIIFFVYYSDLVDYCLKYLRSMPLDSNVIFVSSKEELLGQYRKKMLKYPQYRCEYRIMEGRGRDVAAYLVCCADVFDKYDYICCVHDKKSNSWGNLLNGYHYSEHCFMSCLYNANYVHNVIHTFENNDKLGMLVPPILNFSNFSHLLGAEMWMEVDNVKAVVEKLKLNIPFDEESVIPFGTMFWVRGKSFLPILKYKWKYADFPEEPLPAGCTILHALERAYPFAIQNAGYYVGVCVPDKYASVFLDNQLFMLRELNIKLFSVYGVSDFFNLRNKIGYQRSILTNIAAPFLTKLLKHCRKYAHQKWLINKIKYELSFGKKRKKLKLKYKEWKNIEKQIKES